MQRSAVRRLTGFVAALAVLAGLNAGRAQAQNIELPPTYGSVALQAGFLPDPYVRNVVAGGGIRTNLGGVTSSVANAPDFKLFYTAGNLPLSFYVRSAGDTTLLINLPDGTWVANDDGDGNLDPIIRLPFPQSGRYDIYVGSFNGGNPQASLYISELR